MGDGARSSHAAIAEETDELTMLRLSQDELAIIASFLAPEDLGAFSRSCRSRYITCLVTQMIHTKTLR